MTIQRPMTVDESELVRALLQEKEPRYWIRKLLENIPAALLGIVAGECVLLLVTRVYFFIPPLAISVLICAIASLLFYGIPFFYPLRDFDGESRSRGYIDAGDFG